MNGGELDVQILSTGIIEEQSFMLDLYFSKADGIVISILSKIRLLHFH